LVVCAAIARLYADAEYDSADNCRLCWDNGILPLICKIGEPHGVRVRFYSLRRRACKRLAARQQAPRSPERQIGEDH
jgi:hypothetical protein